MSDYLTRRGTRLERTAAPGDELEVWASDDTFAPRIHNLIQTILAVHWMGGGI